VQQVGVNGLDRQLPSTSVWGLSKLCSSVCLSGCMSVCHTRDKTHEGHVKVVTNHMRRMSQ